MNWHSMTIQECEKELKTDIRRGLSDGEAARRLVTRGRNTLTRKKKKSVIRRFFSQFADFMVLILLGAAAVSFVTAIAGGGDFTDPVMILLIVVLNAVVGTVQECRAESAIDSLKKLSSPHTEVIRGGKRRLIPSEELVPGDLMVVKTGSLICADGRIVESSSLSVIESALTGESVPSEKRHTPVLDSGISPGDRCNMLYSSTIAVRGHGLALVTETGMSTMVGGIASMIDSQESPRTPLQKSLARTGRILGIGALIICVIIFILGMTQNVPPLEMFMIAISLAVAAIPEGLPAVVTIVLALGVRKMALHRAIVRRLPAVETLGSTTVICSDKTGTLTRNKMTVTGLSDGISGISAHSSGGVRLLSLAALCSSAPSGTSGSSSPAGDPTELAVLNAADSAGIKKEGLDRKYPRIGEIPFDSSRKRMLTMHALPSGGCRIIVKGAPDYVLPLCSEIHRQYGISPLDKFTEGKILSANEGFAKKAMRVIAVAFRDMPHAPADPAAGEKGLIFCGLAAMTDPPRPEAKPAVSRCKKAGIRTVMITGDHAMTAAAIAAELGISSPGSPVLTGRELDGMDEKELKKAVLNCSVFARVTPEHKMRIVKALRSCGEVVAMTGDGVNDAPALRCSDIGCAMGRSGTDAARAAADMVLTDDNFSTIVEAVEQGRGIFANIRRTVHFLLSCNIGEILTILCAFLMRLPSPLLALQLLWVNLVTDSMPALALGVEPAGDDLMEHPPLNTSKGVFTSSMTKSIIVEGCFIGALAFLAFTIGRIFFDTGQEPIVGRTMTFAVLSLSQLVHAFNLKSSLSLFKTGISGNMKLVGAFLLGLIMQVSVITVPALNSVFRTVPLSLSQWLIVAALSLSPLILVELSKNLGRRVSPKAAYEGDHKKALPLIRHRVSPSPNGRRL